MSKRLSLWSCEKHSSLFLDEILEGLSWHEQGCPVCGLLEGVGSDKKAEYESFFAYASLIGRAIKIEQEVLEIANALSFLSDEMLGRENEDPEASKSRVLFIQDLIIAQQVLRRARARIMGDFSRMKKSTAHGVDNES